MLKDEEGRVKLRKALMNGKHVFKIKDTRIEKSLKLSNQFIIRKEVT